MKPSEYTPEQVKNASLYGICVVCLTPRELQTTITEEHGKTQTHFALVRPCGHTEADVDAKLDEML